jgi:hypothetical protein
VRTVLGWIAQVNGWQNGGYAFKRNAAPKLRSGCMCVDNGPACDRPACMSTVMTADFVPGGGSNGGDLLRAEYVASRPPQFWANVSRYWSEPTTQVADALYPYCPARPIMEAKSGKAPAGYVLAFNSHATAANAREAHLVGLASVHLQRLDEDALRRWTPCPRRFEAEPTGFGIVRVQA